MKSIRRFAAAALLAAAASALAAQKEPLNPWTDCGIGAAAFPETGWAAASFNLVWDLGTTAVLSEESSEDTCDGAKAQTASYISVNYASLAEETAKGDGRHLQAMLDLMGCRVGREAIIETTRNRFADHLGGVDYPGMSAQDRARNFYDLVVTAASGGQCRL